MKLTELQKWPAKGRLQAGGLCISRKGTSAWSHFLRSHAQPGAGSRGSRMDGVWTLRTVSGSPERVALCSGGGVTTSLGMREDFFL